MPLHDRGAVLRQRLDLAVRDQRAQRVLLVRGDGDRARRRRRRRRRGERQLRRALVLAQPREDDAAVVRVQQKFLGFKARLTRVAGQDAVVEQRFRRRVKSRGDAQVQRHAVLRREVLRRRAEATNRREHRRDRGRRELPRDRDVPQRAAHGRELGRVVARHLRAVESRQERRRERDEATRLVVVNARRVVHRRGRRMRCGDDGVEEVRVRERVRVRRERAGL
mmetsp:Transcript_11052/g.40000  ORF Transcript_11052/g.40000 Transcript_11052/m.40000 type:complete len:223 (-) Transcript_11052:183-851(-)